MRINRTNAAKLFITLVALLAPFVSALAGDGLAPGSTGPDKATANANYDQKLGDKVPLDLAFLDENGTEVTLGSCINNKPTILIMAYYRCPMLCGEVLAGVLDSMRRMGGDFTCGKEFNVVAVSFDPKEKPELAKAKKMYFVTEYGRKEADGGWRFLTGKMPSIEKLTAAVGFHYEYDRMLKEYNHPSGIIVLSPNGTISRYFAGIDYPPAEVKESLQAVAKDNSFVGTREIRDFFSCYRYNPHTGKHSANVMGIMRSGGALMLLLLAGFYAWKCWRIPGIRVMVIGIIGYLSLVPVIMFASMPKLAFVGIYVVMTIAIIVVGRILWKSAKAQRQLPPLAGAGVE
ncbi:MAG: SCO family protein [Gemmataceae bacterium]|nr:SCO family protein [Gemmataceae bacterium]